MDSERQMQEYTTHTARGLFYLFRSASDAASQESTQAAPSASSGRVSICTGAPSSDSTHVGNPLAKKYTPFKVRGRPRTTARPVSRAHDAAAAHAGLVFDAA